MQELPPADARCIVNRCDAAPTVYVDVLGESGADGDSDVPMCDLHAAHWRAGG